jgi:hypothetical protein
MPNRRLTDDECETLFAPILESARAGLLEAGGGDAGAQPNQNSPLESQAKDALDQ